ncbi:MAG: pyridoxal phosphate-dependent class II aminotransferase [Prevotellaceae bacterium]|jgi:threonine-phosphate decarboxylase|nr:pyridoxal phosphate-dependent class II aminotransferase [Prevotellaceae bacterium]
MINGHGDDAYLYEGKIASNFSSNVYTRQDMSALDEHLASVVRSIHSYPEPDAGSLVRLLAEQHEIMPENICATNGATEAIYLVAQAFRGCRTAIVVPTFSEYEDACRVNGHALRFCGSLNDIGEDTRLAWLCNPNNPNGTVADRMLLIEMAARRPDTCFVFDQSYEYFTGKTMLGTKEALQLRNVVLLHSMTKRFAIPGLRLGYLTADGNMIRRIAAYRMPWSVNQLAVEAGKFLVGNSAETVNIAEYLAESRRLQFELSKIDGLTVFPSDTHFFLCRTARGKASELKRRLIETRGILIRNAANFRGLDEGCFRIAAQSVEENNTLVKAVEEWMRLQY